MTLAESCVNSFKIVEYDATRIRRLTDERGTIWYYDGDEDIEFTGPSWT